MGEERDVPVSQSLRAAFEHSFGLAFNQFSTRVEHEISRRRPIAKSNLISRHLMIYRRRRERETNRTSV